MTDQLKDFRQRYRSLAVAACEWRAFGVEDPEVMADWAFASLRTDRKLDLAALFRGIEKAVSMAYSASAAHRSTLDVLRGMAAFGRDIPRPAALIALSELRDHDRQVLQYAYWDGLSRGEISEVLGIDLVAVSERLDRAGRRFTERLAKHGVPADDLAETAREVKPGTHVR
jgi:DNA-directed RNA polymerase specialized sigma24 family protein